MRLRHILILLFALGLLLGFSGEPARATPQATLTATLNNPYCEQSSPASGSCFINMRALFANASDQTFTNLDVSIDGKVRLRMQTFFETSAYVYASMLGKGLQVACGLPNASGDPAFGHRYQVAYAGYLYGYSTPQASGYANVYCPSFETKVYVPYIQK